MDGTLYLSSDGSWQKEIDPSVCSCAFIVKCTESKQELKCTWVEKGESASNYRAELLGAIGNLLVMKAILPDIRTTNYDVTTLPKCKAFCDNMGVVNHGKHRKKPLSEEKGQADLLTANTFLGSWRGSLSYPRKVTRKFSLFRITGTRVFERGSNFNSSTLILKMSFS